MYVVAKLLCTVCANSTLAYHTSHSRLSRCLTTYRAGDVRWEEQSESTRATST